jgi:hypothetical protein
MYDPKSPAKIVGDKLHLSDQKGYDWDLKRDNCSLMFESIALEVRTEAEWFTGRDEPQGEPKFSTSILAKLKPVQRRLFAFKGERFLGPIAAIELLCETGSTNLAYANVWEPDEDSAVSQVTMYLSCQLIEDQFREVFHPIWLRQSKSILCASFYVEGYEPGGQGYHNKELTDHVFESGERLAVKFRSLLLRTNLSGPPPLPS